MTTVRAESGFANVSRHRRVVALGAIAKSSSFPGQSFWMTVFVDPLIGATGLSRAGLSLAYAGATVVSAISASQLGRLADARGVTAAWLLAGLGVVLGSIWLTLAGSFVTVALSIALVRACGQGGMPLVGALAVLRGMGEPRGLAMSLTNSALTLTAAVVPLVATAGVLAIGWERTLVAGGLLVATVTAYGLFLSRSVSALQRPAAAHTRVALHEPGEVVGELVGHDVPVTDDAAGGRARARRPPLGLKGAVLLFLFGLGPMTITAVVFHAFELGRRSEVGPQLVATGLSAMALLGLFGSLVAGPLYDRRGLRAGLMLLSALLTLGPALMLSSTPAGFLGGLGILGLAAGVGNVTGSVAWSRTYGDRHIGAVQGLGAAGVIVGAAIGPLVIAGADQLALPPHAPAAVMTSLGIIALATAANWRPGWEHAPR